MKTRLFVLVLLTSFPFILFWSATAHRLAPLPPNRVTPTPTPTLGPAPAGQPRDGRLPYPPQTVLVQPQRFPLLVTTNASWPLWLGNKSPTTYAIRDELLVTIRALAVIIPELEIETDGSNSDLIIVSGHPVSVSTLRQRLEGHPLLVHITEDSPQERQRARATWPAEPPALKNEPSLFPDGITVNIRNPWVTNIVWGYTFPQAAVHVSLSRPDAGTVTTTATADASGAYHAYLPWEIRDGDVVVVDDGRHAKTITVMPLFLSGHPAPNTFKGTMQQPASALKRTLEMVVGQYTQSVIVDSNGTFTATLPSPSPRPGTPGFLHYTSSDGVQIFTPFSLPVVRIRRNTDHAIPYGLAHAIGINGIVEGNTFPHASLVIKIKRSGTFVITRSTTANQSGYFIVSVDQPILDGDRVEVWDGSTLTAVQVPTLTHHADIPAGIISGTAPANIQSTATGAPHTLQLAFRSVTQPITTDNKGKFQVNFHEAPLIPGLTGVFHYITPAGHHIYKPLFLVDPLVRDKPGDGWADLVLGQPDFTQVPFNEVVANRLFNPGGVYVDRTVQPNRIYVYDGANNRILGLSSLGTCTAGANSGQVCTTNSDCPQSQCEISADKAADIVLGQPGFNTAACNGDSGYQTYPEPPSAGPETLCTQIEATVTTSENGTMATMKTDPQHNLYTPDVYNNRVLRYDNPFATDTIADYVWGQADFSGITCNRGRGYYSTTDAKSLCLAPPPGRGDLKSGVDIDRDGNLWIADTNNNRVLRFPFDAQQGVPAPEADLVLGQPDFSTTNWGSWSNRMNKPASVRVDDEGVVYVADSLNSRVSVFAPPLANGMAATDFLGADFDRPTGLELSPEGGIWVNDSENLRALYFLYGELKRNVPTNDRRAWGGLGIDSGNNIFTAGWDSQQGLHYQAPTYDTWSPFLETEEWGIFNRTGPRAFYAGRGMEIAAGQLIYGDNKRMLFWNTPWDLTNFQPADGVIGPSDFQTQTRWGTEYGRMRADNQGRLWVLYGHPIDQEAVIQEYELPLEANEPPVQIIASPLPLQGGGTFSWSWSIMHGGIDIQPGCDRCLWVSDPLYNRAFRIINFDSEPTVDIVLGQQNIDGTDCNHGRGADAPTQDSLCRPGGLAFDNEGNLFISDHNLEVEGNHRLLEFDASEIPATPATAVFGIPATRVFGRHGDFTRRNCLPKELDPLCAPWEPAFDANGRMVVGFNTYIGLAFPLVYQHPITNPFPIATLGDYHSAPMSIRFDQFGNLYTADHNRNRILIYWQQEMQTCNVTGRILTTQEIPVPNVTVDVAGYAAGSISGATGTYTITGLVTDTYILTPQKSPYLFWPESQTITLPATMRADFVAYNNTLPPLSRFSAEPVQGVVPLTVQFTDESIGFADSWEWHFGNGMTTTVQNPEHTYETSGVYTVSLTTSGPGGSDTLVRPQLIHVTPPPPTATFTVHPSSGFLPLTVQFTDTSTGTIHAWLWNFGDGITSTIQHPQHTYRNSGVYTVTLTVTGPSGSNSETKPAHIAVERAPLYLPVIINRRNP